MEPIIVFVDICSFKKKWHLFLIGFLTVFYTNGNSQNKYSPNYFIGPGIHVNYNGRFGLVDLMAERKLFKLKNSYFIFQVGTGVISSLDSYNRTSYVGIGGFGYSLSIKNNRELEFLSNISTSNEFRFEPGLQCSYSLLAKNKLFKTRLLFRTNLMGDLDYIPKRNPLIFRNKRPLKLYFGVGVRISRALL